MSRLEMGAANDPVLLHLASRRRRVVEPSEIYFLEADGDETSIRLRGVRRLRDVRSMGEVLEDLQSAGFVRVHRNYAVNVHRVTEIRPNRDGAGWQLRLAPPVNRVLPISRRRVRALFAAYRRS